MLCLPSGTHCGNLLFDFSRTAFLPGFVPAEGLHVDVLSQLAPAQPSSWPILDLVVAAEIGEASKYSTLQ